MEYELIKETESGELSPVRVTIEVAGLTEVWESQMCGSVLFSSLAAIESIAFELRARYEMAQQLERDYGSKSGPAE
ncbi:MAG: hypothetical protein ACRD4L_02510 [Pyrinomonadaceae bacterium]